MEYTRFRPVRCTEAQLSNMAIIDGYIYFTLDSGRIYIDKGKQRSLVGGGQGASIYYASGNDISQNAQMFYILTKDMLIDTPSKLNYGDILINKDGTFYKVVYFPPDAADEIWCDIIAVSGGGGGSGSTGPSLAEKINVKISSPSTTNLINGQEFSIDVSATSAVDANGEIQDDKLQLIWELSEKNNSGNFISYHKKTIDISNGEKVSIEIGSLMRENASIRFQVFARGVNSGDSTIKYIDFTTATLSLEPSENFSNLNLFNSSDVAIQCNVVGNTEKLLYYYWDGALLDGFPKALAADASRFQAYNVPSALATHGRHDVLIELYQNANGSNGLKAGELSYEIAVKGNSDLPIIWCNGYKDKYYDYENIQIPFQVYDPKKSTAEITLYKDNKEIGTRQITRSDVNPSFEIWEIVDAQVNNANSYAIVCGDEDRNDRYDISFEVEETDKLKLAFTDALVLKFDATGRSNSESATNREIWENPIEKYSKYKGTFKDFNWYNNGWISDENAQTCLKISNGASFGINFDPMTFSSGVEGANSWTIEMQFKVSNVRNYNNLITTYTRYKGDSEYWTSFEAQKDSLIGQTNYDAYLRDLLGEAADELEYSHIQKVINTKAAICQFYDGERGFCLGPQDAFFTTKQDTVNINYTEDDMVNLAIVFSHSNQFISIYLNGILTGIEKSTIGGRFIINSNTIQFNSDYCDINLYKMRVYNTNLAINYIDLNLATDKKDIDIYDQTNLAKYNSSLNEYQFDYEAMLEYNKTHTDNEIMPYVVWTTTGKTQEDNNLPYSKANVINANMEFHNVALDRAYLNGTLNDYAAKDGLTDEECQEKYGMTAVQYYYMHHCPSWHGDNVEMKVQGTSSEYYPRRNYKVKTKIADDDTSKKYVHMYMNEGPFEGEEKQLDWFYYDNYTVGTTKFTMKIDFMESSGSYNVGFANLVHTAYTKHPIDDYISAGAFQKVDPDSSAQVEVSSYDPTIIYSYYNHKGKLKTADGQEDNLIISSQEDFDLGPYALYQKLMVENPSLYTKLKVADEESEYYNKWYKSTVGYKACTADDIQTYDYRTSVQGFPVLAFHKRSDTGEIKYIGRYNMILDKGSDEAYGFALDDIYQKFAENKDVSKVAECWEYSDNLGTFCSFRDPLNRSELSFDTGTLSSNGGPLVVDSFEYRYHDAADDLDLIYGLKSATPEQLQELAAKYNLSDLSAENKQPAIDWALEIMKNWEKACAWVYSTCVDVVPTNKEVQTGDWTSIQSKYNKTEDDLTLSPPVVYEKTSYQYDTQEYRLAKFRTELSDHFDIDYVATYFVMTEVFECYDSRGKNCMMASWGPLKEGGEYIWYPIFYDIDTQLGINNTGIPSFTFDIDATQDGNFSTNNSVLWDNFFTCYKDSYIRQKYRQLRGYTDEIGSFSKIAKAPLSSVDRIERWYLADPEECGRGKTKLSETHPFLAMQGQRPLIALNLDEYYKYITITNNNISAGGGYAGQDGSWISDNSNGQPTGTYFYALQGDRSLSRQQFLTNRLNYIDSWLNCGEFARGEGTGVLWGRISANIPSEFPDLWITQPATDLQQENLTVDDYWEEDGITKKHEFDAEYWVTLTPSKTTYVSIGLDNEALSELSQKAKNTAVKIELPASVKDTIMSQPKKDEQLLYIYGASQMSDLGDMSKLYWSEFHMPTNCNKLTRLMLGNDNFDCVDGNGNSIGYYRKDAQKLGLADMPLLQECCISGIKTSLGGVTYSFTSSEKLRSFRALRTDLTNISFAKGVALDTLYLPSGIVKLELIEARKLTKLLTEYPVTKGEKTGEYNCESGLYIEQLFDPSTPTTSINTIDIEGEKLGYDSYRLIKQIVTLSGNQDVAITDIGINWCPYEQLVEGDVYNSEEADLYFQDNNHYGFDPYVYSSEASWNLDILNGKVYKLNNDYFTDNEDLITDVSFFETLKKCTSATEPDSKPTLNGIVFINNSNKELIDESYIRNDLQEAYPDLQFFVANIKKGYSAEFRQMEDDGTYQTLGLQKISADDITTSWFENPYTMYNPKKLDYDFIGWATDADGKNMIGTKVEGTSEYIISDEDWLAKKDDLYASETFDYIFYAIFEIHAYSVRFLDGDGSDLIEPLALPYGTIGVTEPIKVPYLDDSKLDLTQTYSFTGYKDNPSAVKLVDLTKYVIRKDTVFYPEFKEISVYDNVHSEYFSGTYNNSYDGYVLSLDKEVQGKITIPAKYNGSFVYELTPTFSSSSDNAESKGQYLTHVFFEKDSQIKALQLECFADMKTNSLSNLEYVEFPESLTTINDKAFYRCKKLNIDTLNNLASSNVTYIGDRAFQQAFDSTYGIVDSIYIRGIVTKIGVNAFMNLGIKFDNFVIGSITEMSQLDLTTNTSGSIVSVGNTGYSYNVTVYTKNSTLTPITLTPYFSGASTINVKGS